MSTRRTRNLKIVQIDRKGVSGQIGYMEYKASSFYFIFNLGLYFQGSPTEVTRRWFLTHNGSNMPNHANNVPFAGPHLGVNLTTHRKRA